MAYNAWSVVFGEQPTAAKWNQLGTNDAGFKDGTNFDDSIILNRHLAAGNVVNAASATSSAVSTGTTTIPLDDTIPQNTEGTEFLTVSITPKSASNILLIIATGHISSSIANNNLLMALFRDTTADALATARQRSPAVADAGETIPLFHAVVAGSTSATTFKLRGGGNGASTFTFNGASAARLFGASAKSSLLVLEYKA